jgi:hypothetical protein
MVVEVPVAAVELDVVFNVVIILVSIEKLTPWGSYSIVLIRMYDPRVARTCGSVALIVINAARVSISRTVLKAFSDAASMVVRKFPAAPEAKHDS